MIKTIIERGSDSRRLREIEAVPECGKDFCDRCGDCLACFPDYCGSSDDEQHVWLQDGEDSPHVHEWNPIGDYCIACGVKRETQPN